MERNNFKVPEKQLNSMSEMDIWLKSEAATNLIDWIAQLNHSVVGKTMKDPSLKTEVLPPVIVSILQALDTLLEDVKAIPPQTQPQRFGNKAFRVWFELMSNKTPEFMRQIIMATGMSLTKEKVDAIVDEIGVYFINSFGNNTRIDYGTGHEMCFATWMLTLQLLNFVSTEHHMALVLRVFARYLDVVRELQKVYALEPAGSHGVWGLDDYQFLPFLWGSAQFIDHPIVKPKSITNLDMVDSLAPEYLFMGGIKFIHELKTGPFAEHSPFLYDISAVPLWAKVNSGLHKMYVAEVMKKFPIVQHFLFGSLLTLAPAPKVHPLLL